MRFNKGDKTKISEHFFAHEFDCPCDHPECNYTEVGGDLIAKLEKLRALAWHPIIVTRGGGYRCHHYECDLRNRGYETADGLSTHETGFAADIAIPSLTGEQIEKLAREAGFMAVGVADLWCHIDTREDKNRRWVYTKLQVSRP